MSLSDVIGCQDVFVQYPSMSLLFSDGGDIEYALCQ